MVVQGDDSRAHHEQGRDRDLDRAFHDVVEAVVAYDDQVVVARDDAYRVAVVVRSS